MNKTSVFHTRMLSYYSSCVNGDCLLESSRYTGVLWTLYAMYCWHFNVAVCVDVSWIIVALRHIMVETTAFWDMTLLINSADYSRLYIISMTSNFSPFSSKGPDKKITGGKILLVISFLISMHVRCIMWHRANTYTQGVVGVMLDLNHLLNQ